MTDSSPAKRLWRNFRRNTWALVGLIFIVLTAAAAIFGYLIVPDNTPQANDMLLQLSIKHPGSTFTILTIRKEEDIPVSIFFTKTLFGQTDPFKNIPITGYHFIKDSIYVDEYIGDEDPPERTRFNIFEVVTGKKPLIKDDGEMVAADGSNYLSRVAARDIYRNKIETEQIVERKFWLGTDIYGRDLLSRIILGARISLAVGLVSVIISLLLGIVVGATAGYFGGWADAALSWLMNVVWALPSLLLVIAISFALGKGMWQVFIAIGVSTWVDVARMVRGQVISLKNLEFVEAAKALGFKNSRIIARHILPNITGPILVLASSNFASAILLEAGLSFLGFGAQPPTPTWGGMIKEHYGYIIMDAAYLALFPGLAIMLIVYAFNLVTIGLRDAMDVKSENGRL